VSAIVLLLPLGFGLLRFPSALSASLAFERGRRAEASGYYDVAVVEYSKVVQRFPDSTRAVARKGIAAFHAGQYQIAAQAFQTIAGRDASQDIAHEVNEAIDLMIKGRK
jgi:lipoprotein NlpI